MLRTPPTSPHRSQSTIAACRVDTATVTIKISTYLPQLFWAYAVFGSELLVVVLLSGLSGIKFSMACKMMVSDNLLDMARSNASRCCCCCCSGNNNGPDTAFVKVGLETTLAVAVDDEEEACSMTRDEETAWRMRNRREVVDVSIVSWIASSFWLSSLFFSKTWSPTYEKMPLKHARDSRMWCRTPHSITWMMVECYVGCCADCGGHRGEFNNK